jgi:hypothetical protein
MRFMILVKDSGVMPDPFAEAKELVAGYTMSQARSKEDGHEAEIEVRQLYELDDFPPGEAVERFREMGAAGRK